MTRQKINRISVVLLVVGFGSALAVYLTMRPAPDDPFLADPLANKAYLYQMKRLGGEANVLASEFREWCAAQWQGVLLARTIAILTVATVLGFRFATIHPGPADPVEEKAPPLSKTGR